MKNFIITLLSTLALSLSASVFAGGTVVEAPTDSPAQVAPLPAAEEEVAGTDAAECDAEKADCAKEETAATPECDAESADCDKEETAAAPETTDSPVQVAPAADTTAS